MGYFDVIDKFSAINFQEPTWDLFIVAFFVLAVALYGFSMGKSRLVVNMVAIYIAIAIATAIPDISALMNWIGHQYAFIIQVATFLIAFIGLYYLISRKSPLARVAHTARKEKIVHIIMYSIVHVGLILATILSFIPADAGIELSPITNTIFRHEIAHFAWILAPVAMMILFPEKIRRSYDD